MNRLGTMFGMLPGAALGAALLLALGTGVAEAQAPAGVTAAVNPQATGTPPALPTRVLEVGGNVVQNERLTTGPEGQAQLLFRDGSTMTLGPDSDLTIDNFVYDPEAKTAKLAMTAAVGVFRFVGGRASKDEPVIINTPTTTIGIRGGMGITSVNSGGTEHTKVHGTSTSFTSKSTGESYTQIKDGFTVTIKTNQPITTAKIDPAKLAATLAGFFGHAGASGGGTSPDQNSQGVQHIASSNSGEPAISFSPGSVTITTNNLSFVQQYITQLISQTAQTVVAGEAPSVLIPPTGGSGSFSAGIVSGMLNNTSSQSSFSNLQAIASPFSNLTYTITSSGSSQTVTQNETSNFSVTGNFSVGGVVTANLTSVSTLAGSFSGGSFSNTTNVASTIQNAVVAELGGDNLIQFGRLLGGTASTTTNSSFTSTFNGQTFSSGGTPVTQTSSCALCSSHFIIGVPASNLPSVGTFNYSLLGATSPTFGNGSGSPGSFSGSLNITFGVNPSQLSGSSSVSYSGISGLIVALNGTVTMPGDATYNLSTVGGLSNPSAQLAQIASGTFKGTLTGFSAQAGAGFSGNPLVTVTGVSQACPTPSTCGAFVTGFLAGSGGTRVGLLYTIGNNIGQSNTGPLNLSQVIIGAAAFKR